MQSGAVTGFRHLFSILKINYKEKLIKSKKQKEYWANLTNEDKKKISDERKSRMKTSAKVVAALEKGRESLRKKGVKNII